MCSDYTDYPHCAGAGTAEALDLAIDADYFWPLEKPLDNFPTPLSSNRFVPKFVIVPSPLRLAINQRIKYDGGSTT